MTNQELLKQALAVAEEAQKKGGLIKRVASLIVELVNAELKGAKEA